MLLCPSGDLLWADFERIETFSDEVVFFAWILLIPHVSELDKFSTFECRS